MFAENSASYLLYQYRFVSVMNLVLANHPQHQRCPPLNLPRPHNRHLPLQSRGKVQIKRSGNSEPDAAMLRAVIFNFIPQFPRVGTMKATVT